MKISVFIKVGIVITMFLLGITTGFSDREKDDRLPGTSYSGSFAQNLDNSVSDSTGISYIDTIIEGFIQKCHIPGASVAISKNGKLLYAKGYGYSNIEKAEKVKPGSLFRVASVSKLLTAIAVLKMHEDGMLDLDQKVFGEGGILSGYDYSLVRDSNLFEITVSHLLKHTGGWEKKNGDPLFMPVGIARAMKVPPPASIETIIQFMIGRPLDYTPGTTYSYSNFGYALLGEVIEERSGLPYEDFVKVKILHPIGVFDMQLGKSFYHERALNEVKYYEPDAAYRTPVFNGTGQFVPLAYGGNYMEILGAAGGWIATAPELLKLVAAIDGESTSPDIISPESLAMMTRVEGRYNRGPLGWHASDGMGMWWRPGGLAGCSSLLLHQRNEVSWVMLLNYGSVEHNYYHPQLSATMFKAISHIQHWPEVDLFDYQYPQLLAYGD